jgi:DMSO/TMAO reductase YedYZ molybdopterin-dependent catalytic subunit
MTSRRRRSQAWALTAALAMIGLDVEAQQDQSKTRPTPRSSLKAGTSVLLEVQGEVPRPLAVSAAEFAKLPRQAVRAQGHDRVESQFEGVALFEVLSRAGVPFGKELRGQAMALYLVVEASDGYRAVFALPELDPGFAERVILLADRRDGRPLSDQAGPLQVIVPGEKKHARWVRQVIRLRIGRA